jgi:hypothetical protein
MAQPKINKIISKGISLTKRRPKSTIPTCINRTEIFAQNLDEHNNSIVIHKWIEFIIW